MFPFLRFLVAALAASLGFSLAGAEASSSNASGALSGVVVTAGGEPAAGARVVLRELSRRATADDRGAFRFDDVPAGHYDVEVISPRFGSAAVEIDVFPGRTAELQIRLDLGVHSETVVVTASPEARSIFETARPVSVIDGTEIQQRAAPTLGETLAGEPGVAATGFAPGASRPVIRGFSGDRIRILENGLPSGDASNVSPDHAVGYDPIAAERIEIVRGPASLLYGSAAVGGVVNVLDGRVPDHLPTAPVTGAVDLRAGSAAGERTAGIGLAGGIGEVAWQVRGLDRSTDDLDTPRGTIANSDLDSSTVSAGGSWIGDHGFVGIAYSEFRTNYGNAVEEAVRVDLHQKRIDARGEWNRPFGIFRSFKARIGSADYEHSELEGAEVGTLFTNDSIEGRFELAHKTRGAFSGTVGLQLGRREFAALGEEAFVRPTRTNAQGLFLFEEVGRGKLRGEFGLRWERQQSESDEDLLPDRDFQGISASAGILWFADEAWAVASTLSRTTRFPTPEELYSFGPHIATNAFEVGDPNLREETGLGIDLAVRKRAGKVMGELTLFHNSLGDYVYERDTGTVDPDSGLPILAFTQADAEFRGAEIDLHVELFHSEPHHLELDLRADYVRAELTSPRENLPRITPMRASVGLYYQGPALWARVDVLRVEDQDRVAPGETPTPGATRLDASIGYRIVGRRIVHDLVLRGANLTDQLAFNHVSRFKDAVPLSGRDLTLAYRLAF